MLSVRFLLFLFLMRFFQIKAIMNHPSYKTQVSYSLPFWLRKPISNRNERIIPLASSTENVLEKRKFSMQKPKRYNDLDIGSVHDFERQALSVMNRQMDMPFFDTDKAPIFIYNMPSGQMIVNTMLSKQKFPMKEPVPGQVLHPPAVPLFKPIENRIHSLSGKRETANLTLIPFYEHEAVYYTTTTLKPRRSTDLRSGRKERPFYAYRSPDEVNWQPYVKYNGMCTTPFPAAIPSPLWNHRLPADFKPTAATTTTDMVDNVGLHIVYETEEKVEEEEEVEERMRQPKLSSRYSVAQNYLGFPVFSLGKLLNTPKYKQIHKYEYEKQEQQNKQINETDTWFIINSRETPTMFKEVPLTYFRTYTYQPLAGNPMVPLPYLTNGLMTDRSDLPLMHGGRYDNFDASFANLKNVYASPLSPFLSKYQSTRKPYTTRATTTTTTTTTTTPAPTTTTAASKEQFYAEYPTYNRRQYFANYPNYQRQPYPYPNYQNYQNSINYMERPEANNVPFMSCICPAVGVSKNDNVFAYGSQSRATQNAINTQGIADNTPAETQALPVVYQKAEEEARGTSTEVPTEKNNLFSAKTMPL